MSLYLRVGKRALDLAIAAPALAALAPVMVAIGLGVRADVGKPVLFRQRRPGLHGEPFVLLKFRTMRGTRDAQGNLLPDDQRLTRFGRFLRSTSLDELPSLLNVVRGEMGLVGPRPLLMEYLPLYSEVQRRRHLVRPGVTGWAQVNGRNAISWAEKLALDVWYVDHCTLLLDLRILARTVRAVLLREGISAEGSATMPLFTGNSAEQQA